MALLRADGRGCPALEKVKGRRVVPMGFLLTRCHRKLGTSVLRAQGQQRSPQAQRWPWVVRRQLSAAMTWVLVSLRDGAQWSRAAWSGLCERQVLLCQERQGGLPGAGNAWGFQAGAEWG